MRLPPGRAQSLAGRPQLLYPIVFTRVQPENARKSSGGVSVEEWHGPVGWGGMDRHGEAPGELTGQPVAFASEPRADKPAHVTRIDEPRHQASDAPIFGAGLKCDLHTRRPCLDCLHPGTRPASSAPAQSRRGGCGNVAPDFCRSVPRTFAVRSFLFQPRRSQRGLGPPTS